MVYIFLADGFEESEALVPADLLRRAGIETALVSIGDLLVVGSHGITVQADLTAGQVDMRRAELLLLPGGLGGVKNLSREHSLAGLFQVAQEQGIRIAAICAAPTLLDQWGLLDGKKAVCYPGMEDRMPSASPQMDQRVVVDDGVITGRAAGSAFDFGLALVEALAGKEKAEEVRHAVWY